MTAELAGYPDATVDEDLAEWAYGSYEGITTARSARRFRAGPSGHTRARVARRADDVRARVDRVIVRSRAAGGDVLLFGHSHALRALTARWLGQPVTDGRFFRLDTATLSVLGYERETPVILRWNA